MKTLGYGISSSFLCTSPNNEVYYKFSYGILWRWISSPLFVVVTSDLSISYVDIRWHLPASCVVRFRSISVVRYSSPKRDILVENFSNIVNNYWAFIPRNGISLNLLPQTTRDGRPSPWRTTWLHILVVPWRWPAVFASPSTSQLRQ